MGGEGKRRGGRSGIWRGKGRVMETCKVQRVQGIGNICILSMTTQTHFITNCLVTIVQTKPVNSNFSPKIGCHGYGPHPTRFLQPVRAHNPNGIPIVSAVFAQTTVECPYTLQWDAHSPQKICPFPWGDLDPI